MLPALPGIQFTCTQAGRLQERTDEDARPLLLLQRCSGDRVCIDGFDPMDDGSIFMMMIRPWRRLGSDRSDALPADYGSKPSG
jgi:hypothetical protein